MKARNMGFGVAVAVLLLSGCDQGARVDQSANVEAIHDIMAAPETINQRLARQKKYLPSVNRNALPAPDGDAIPASSKVIRANGCRCGQVVSAKRFDSDGTIVANCSNGESYRVFGIQGVATTFALKCSETRRIIGVDPCDADSIASRSDTSIDETMKTLGR